MRNHVCPKSALTSSAFAASAFALVMMAASMGARAQSAGYYTLDQAQAGVDIYQKKCASCHGAEMEGYIGPALRGHAFQVIASRQTSADRLLLIISRNEPEDDPGSLSDEEDSDVLAYILQMNGYPAGKDKLSALTARGLDLTAGR